MKSIKSGLWRRLQNVRYRRAFAEANVGARIASQLLALRKKHGLSQEELAKQVGMAQGRISVMEKPSYQNYNLKTLRRLAGIYDLALVVEFVSFKTLVNRIGDSTAANFAPLSFNEEISAEDGQDNQASLQQFDSSQLLLLNQPPVTTDEKLLKLNNTASGANTIDSSVETCPVYRTDNLYDLLKFKEFKATANLPKLPDGNLGSGGGDLLKEAI